jgi:hypothetical protein
MPQGRKSSGSYLDYLSFDRILAGDSLKLVYWIGLGLIALFAFASLGASIGIVLNDLSLRGILFGIPALIGGLLITVALVIIWRLICEFIAVIFRISEDLRALREAQERDTDIFRR